MSSNPVIQFKEVWKKYSKSRIFHKSLREDLMSLLEIQKGHELLKDEFWALEDQNFTISKGECVALYGPNGSGKSTVLKLIANITHPTEGSVLVKESVAPLIAVDAGFHPDLSGRDNIFVNGAILGMRIKEIHKNMESIIEFSGIKEFMDMPVKKYSSGMYVRLAFSVAVHSNAGIYLFDEIITTADQEFKEKCFQKISDLKKQNKTIIFVTHDLNLIKDLQERTIVLNKGRIIKE